MSCWHPPSPFPPPFTSLILPLPFLLTRSHRYVAMHSMQESASPHSHDASNGYVDANMLDPVYARDRKKGPSAAEIVVAVVGMLVPLVTQVGHHH